MAKILEVLKGMEKELAQSGHQIVIDAQHFLHFNGKKVARVAETLVGSVEEASEEIIAIIAKEVKTIVETISQAEGVPVQVSIQDAPVSPAPEAPVVPTSETPVTPEVVVDAPAEEKKPEVQE